MRIADFLQIDRIALGVSARDAAAVQELLADLQMKSGSITDRSAYLAAIRAREAQGSTAVGQGIAVPHAKAACVKAPCLSAAVLTRPAAYPDAKNAADLFFIIAAPEGAQAHLEILARLMKLLMDPAFARDLRQAPDSKAFLSVIDRYDRQTAGAAGTASASILAVTACPTGIAHTYMAAEALEKKGRELGISVKAETQGSGGAQNVLSPEEIAACDGIIIAADKEVDLSRFRGKPVLQVPVSEGIRNPEALIRKAPGAPVYQSGGPASESREVRDGAGRSLYKQLMNGVSHMLPFVIGGGILIALAFLLDDPSLDYANFGSNTPVAAWLKTVGGVAFDFMLPILSGYIALSIADRPGLMVGFVGGALAVSGATFSSPVGSSVSAGFLGALAAGFLGGYLTLGLRKLLSGLPKSLEGIKPVLLYPLAGLLLIGVVMCLINPVIGRLNSALYTGLSNLSSASRILLGFLTAAMMAIDMGGPFNKAAYLFGTSTLTAAALSQGGSPIMASVMIGGMVPPIAIALAATFFPDRFTKEERQSGPVNYIMGLCFITEGAIPFAASDPLRVLPACIAGSGLAGALSMAFGCASPAPHGGLFVFPVMSHIGGYLLALAAGSLLGMLLLALLKPKKS